MIVCGWCHQDTPPARCSACGRDPSIPWVQRALEPPTVDDREIHRRALAEADRSLRAEGVEPTIDRLADRLGLDPRTVRRWRADVRPVS